MPDITKNTIDETFQLSRKQKTDQKEYEVPLFIHYPVVVRGGAGPLTVIKPDSFLDQVTRHYRWGR